MDFLRTLLAKLGFATFKEQIEAISLYENLVGVRPESVAPAAAKALFAIRDGKLRAKLCEHKGMVCGFWIYRNEESVMGVYRDFGDFWQMWEGTKRIASYRLDLFYMAIDYMLFCVGSELP